MMTLKTSLRSILISWLCLLCTSVMADDIACLRELLPVSDKVTIHGERKGWEKPFLVNDKFIVFPEVKEGKVTGFYVYGKKRGQYYDLVQSPSKKVLRRTGLTELALGTIYDMVAQPEGLETVTIAFAPALKSIPSRTPSSAALGASMLPVVGAFVALQEKQDSRPVYVWPDPLQSENKPRKLLQLASSSTKSAQELLEPVQNELEIRKKAIQKANLDDATFKDLSRILQHSCNSL
jgi:hypothetical protein